LPVTCITTGLMLHIDVLLGCNLVLVAS